MSDRFALEARGVIKRYGRHEVLRGVDLVVEPGRLHGLLGSNGAGKTTLLRILLRLIQHDAGTVHALGHELDSTRPVPDGVSGFVETPTFYPYLSGRENLLLLTRLDDTRRFGGGDPVNALIERVGLTTQQHKPVNTYSAGMRQRLGVAAALIRAPRLLLLDEPTGALDPGGARDVRHLVRRVADEGAAVVLSSHDMAEVEELCDTITVMDRGRVIFSGTVDELRWLAPAARHVLHTNDDRAAIDIASRHSRLSVTPAADGGLDVSAEAQAPLDTYIMALGSSGIAVRTLERRTRSLQAIFLDLTSELSRSTS